jgi:hypothetical protein
MTLKKQMRRHFGKKAARRIYSAMPWVGGGLALAVGTVLKRRSVRGAVEHVRDMDSSITDEVKRSAAAEPDNDLVGSH